MAKFDLRFAGAEESEYQQSLQHHFVFPVILGTGAIMCVSIWLTIAAWQSLKDTEDGLVMVAMVGARFIAVISSFMLLFICILRSQTKFLRSLSIEALGMAWVLKIIILLCWFNAWHGPKMFGKDPHQVFPDYDMVSVESNVLITICTLTSATCLVAPVRIHLSWLVPGCGLVSFYSATVLFGSPAEEGLLLNGLSFILLVISAMYGAYKNERYQRQEYLAQRKVDFQQYQLKTQYDGVCRILNILCDCLISIGSDGQIVEPNVRFAAMLMHTGRQTLEGTSFYDYISDQAGKDRFKLMVTGTQTQTSHNSVMEFASTAGMFHIHLRDVCGKSFPVDIYHTQMAYDSDKSDTKYLVGIVEKSEPSDREVVQARIESQLFNTPDPEPDVIGLIQDRGSPGSSMQGTEAIDMTSSISGSSDAEHALTSNTDLVAVEFFADVDAGFPVISCTPGFLSMSGPLTDRHPLLTFIEDQHEISSCIQDMSNTFYYECRQEIGELVFAKPSGPIKYRVDCISLDIIRYEAGPIPSPDWKAGADLVVRAVFNGIQQRRQRRRRLSSMNNTRSQTRVTILDSSAQSSEEVVGHDAGSQSI